MRFTAADLLGRLPAEDGGPLWVAYSGGLDSHVLLHACSSLRERLPADVNLRALHVNHGIHPDADAWEQHCEAVCEALGVPLDLHRVRLSDAAAASLETRARHARYAAFRATLTGGGWLLLAQHADDQAETLLFRLLRGAGSRGLAGMPYERALGAGRLRRPLLPYARADLAAYAVREGLSWIEDDSNRDPAHDRNYLRHEILPRLAERWPGYRGAFARSARLSGEAQGLLDVLAEQDLAACRADSPCCIRLAGLRGLEPARQRNLLRYWFDGLAADQRLPPPGHAALEAIVNELLPAREDARPLVAWEGRGGRGEARRHAGRLYALRSLPPVPAGLRFDWDLRTPLGLGEGLGRLSLEPAAQGLALTSLTRLQVSFRSGGEVVRPAGRPSRPLKKFLQEAGLPPWLRDRAPLLHHGDALVAVADLCLSEGWRREGEDGLFRIRWERPAPG